MLVQIVLTEVEETVRTSLNGRFRVKLAGIDWSDDEDKNKKYLLKMISPNISSRNGNILYFSNMTDHHHSFGDVTFELECNNSFTVSGITSYAGDVFVPGDMEYLVLWFDVIEQLN